MSLPLPPGGILSLPLLAAEASEDWVLVVLMQEAQWLARHRQVPFYTLGLAAYLDAQASPPRYHHRGLRERSNALLAACFMPLLQAVASALQRLLGVPARLAGDAAALPGFHIYMPHPAFGGLVASVHRDLQYRDAFPGVQPQTGDVFSFTLPLCHPPGSGLRQWPGCSSAARLVAGDGALLAPEFHAYRPGELMVHDGLSVHQAVVGWDGDSPRITLQGHGLRVRGSYLLYW